MTQLRAVSAAASLAAVVLVLGVPLMILLMLDPASASGCGSGTPTGPGPASVPGIPQNLLPIFEGAGQQYGLGNDGWAYLAALNNAESTFGTNNGPGTGVLSGANSAGAAGPMQIGIGGQATDNWDTIVNLIPPSLPGGVQPPSVYNEVDAVYGAAALLKKWGAPGTWQAALVAWNNYPPEIAQVTQLVAQYTQTGQGTGRAAGGTTSTAAAPVATAGAGCAPVSGPTTPGAVARVLSNGLAELPQGAPPAVQEMIAAGDQIIDKPYIWGGGHGSFTASGYDCSGAVSYVLHGAGLMASPLDSTALQSYGAPNAGQWVTVYAGTSGGQGHTFIEIAGIVLDTVHGTPTAPAGSGPRWQPASEVAYELRTGSFVARHPQGL